MALLGLRNFARDRLDHLYPFCIVDWHTKKFLKVQNTLTLETLFVGSCVASLAI